MHVMALVGSCNNNEIMSWGDTINNVRGDSFRGNTVRYDTVNASFCKVRTTVPHSI